jgi:hypothetical protein
MYKEARAAPPTPVGFNRVECRSCAHNYLSAPPPFSWGGEIFIFTKISFWSVYSLKTQTFIYFYHINFIKPKILHVHINKVATVAMSSESQTPPTASECVEEVADNTRTTAALSPSSELTWGGRGRGLGFFVDFFL